MKYILFYLSFFLLFGISSCIKDYAGIFPFIIKNSTQDTITLKFLKELDYGLYYDNKQEVVLLPTEEKVVRTFSLANILAHDWMKTNFDDMFPELKFDTYIDTSKLEKDLWQPDNWTYHEKSKWEAEYNMTITNAMIGK